MCPLRQLIVAALGPLFVAVRVMYSGDQIRYGQVWHDTGQAGL